ncbi:hypothetical protein FYJ45_24395 [Eisenbergiella tayi]|uniref:Uncharacterized protein n=1 Tax=Eisenbergiella porci TaxID=2652274 RepID=A0A6N7W7Q4_9FIRM|nr:hypothetical protein [Eisenbergiella porci]MSS91259.1 hypothetical protein [Eisenbergiella porci]
MAFKKKTWTDRMVEYAGRRKLTNVSTKQAVIYDVERSEGTVSKEGDAFSSQNMNDLEQRVADGFSEVKQTTDGLIQNLGALNDSGAIKGMDAREDGVYITYTPVAGADTVTKKLGSGISFRWKYAGQPNVVSGTIQQISEIDVSNYTFATFAVHTNSANLDINILGNGTAISSFKTGTQKLNVNEYTSISANFAVKYNLPATIDITITLD